MATGITWDVLRRLAGFRAQQGCAVSFYVNLSPSEAPTLADVVSRVTSVLDAAGRSAEAKREALTHAERQALREDLDRIGAYFDSGFDRSGVQGAAVFAAGLDNFFQPLAVTEPVPDGARLGRSFSLKPLVPLVGRADGAIVAVVGRERGELYRVRSGRLDELADLTEEQLNRHEQGGWSQANYQRHVDEHAKEHLRDVAEVLAQQVRRLRASDVVIVGADETRALFLDLLPEEARRAVVGGAHAEAHAGPNELLDAAEPLLREARLIRERQCLERWREEAARGGRAVGGWEDTLEAASDARVELLLYNHGAGRPAYECPACGRASASDGSCPLDGTKLEQTEDGVDLAVHHSLTHGGAALAVEEAHDLDPVGGIGALLRF